MCSLIERPATVLSPLKVSIAERNIILQRYEGLVMEIRVFEKPNLHNLPTCQNRRAAMIYLRKNKQRQIRIICKLQFTNINSIASCLKKEQAHRQTLRKKQKGLYSQRANNTTYQ
jgi:hypothetical protein